MSINNTNYGTSSLNNNSGSDNSSFGAYSAYNNLDGSCNTAIGSNSLFYNTIGSYNTSVGAGSLCNNDVGSRNTAVGSSALEGLVSNQSVGNRNTAVGAQALFSNTGDYNTGVGTYAALDITSGNYNTFLGANTTFSNTANTYEYSTALGYGAAISTSNQIMMGRTNTNVMIPGTAQFQLYNPNSYNDLSVVAKEYVDSVASGLTPSYSGVCATTASINGGGIPSGSPPTTSTDNVTIATGDYVLVINQGGAANTRTNNVNNGLWIVNLSGAWSRPPSGSMSVGTSAIGDFNFIQSGTTYGSRALVQISNPAIVGTDPLQYTLFYQLNVGTGQGINVTNQSGKQIISVDSSLNFINYLDNYAGPNPGIMNIGGYTSRVIIGPTAGNGKPVIVTNGITGPTGSFTNLNVSGRVGIGRTDPSSILDVSGNCQITGDVSCTNTTASTNTTSGALVVSGGVGIAGALNVGQNCNINSLTVGRGRQNNSTNTVFGYQAFANDNTATACTAIGYQALASNADNNSSTALGYKAGAINARRDGLTFVGAFTDSAGNFMNSTALGVGATITADNQIVLGRSSESVNIPGNAASTNTTSGALVVSGGVGIAGALNVGGNVGISGSITGATGSFTNISTNVISFPNDKVQINGLIGQVNQGVNTVAIGAYAGQNTQGQYAVAIGSGAGQNTQGLAAVAIGNSAGQYSQGQSAVAIGNYAGTNTQGGSAVAIGNSAGYNTQGSGAVAIGNSAGRNSQGQNAIAIGSGAGQNTQGTNAIAIGSSAGINSQGTNAVAVGAGAGQTNQGTSSIAIGQNAGQNNQKINAIAIGQNTGLIFQDQNAIAIGESSGQNTQSANAIAIGSKAGNSSQGPQTIAIGSSAGFSNQGQYGIAIGATSGFVSQGTLAVAIGGSAGAYNQGTNAIAIGANAGLTNQPANSIVINASGNGLNGATQSAFYANPVRLNNTNTAGNMLNYNTSTSEISYTSNVFYNNGNLGIGTTTPSKPLEIFGASGGLLKLVNNTVAYQGGQSNIEFWNNNSGYRLGQISAIDTATTTGSVYRSALALSASFHTDNFVEGMRIVSQSASTAFVGIGTTTPAFTLDVSGNTRSTGTFTSSDYRLKTNIKPLLRSIDDLKPLEYDLDGKHDMGFIAHEVQEVFPFLVHGEKDGTEMQSLNYTGFIALLVKEVQELKKENKLIREKLEQM